MKPPKHSKTSEKAHPAPVRADFKTAKAYAEACRLVNEARIAFDAPKTDKAKVSTKPSKSPIALPDSSKNKQVAEKAEKTSETLTPTQRLDQVGIDVICECVAGGQSLRAWATENGFVQQTVINWIDADNDRAGHYARARDERADFVFESLDDVSDQAVRAETAVEVAGLRLKADNIKWKLARMNAKKYGDKLAVGGADDMPGIKIERIERIIVGQK